MRVSAAAALELHNSSLSEEEIEWYIHTTLDPSLQADQLREAGLDEALHELKAGEETMRTIDQRIARSLVANGNDPNMPAEEHPRFRHQMAVREQALVDLSRTIVRAPAR